MALIGVSLRARKLEVGGETVYKIDILGLPDADHRRPVLQFPTEISVGPHLPTLVEQGLRYMTRCGFKDVDVILQDCR